MLDLALFKSDRDRLAWHLKWGRFIVPEAGVVRQKDESITRSFEFRGRDLDSTDDEELLQAVEHLNSMLGAFGKRWTLHFEYRNFHARQWPDRNITNPAARLVDDERRKILGTRGQLAEQRYFFTVTYQPPPKTVAKLQAVFHRKRIDAEAISLYQSLIEPFVRATDLFRDQVDKHLSFCRSMDDDETVSYYSWCLDFDYLRLKMPKAAGFPLCNVAVGSPIVPGSFPSFIGYDAEKEAGECDSVEIHMRPISIRGYPEVSYPDLLNGLSNITTEDGKIIEFRFVQRFICLAQEEMETEMRERYRVRKNSEYTAWDIARTWISRNAVVEPDPTAVVGQMAARAALTASAAEGDETSLSGYLTPVIVVWDRSVTLVDEKVRKVREFFGQRQYKTEVETLNAMEAFYSTLPGEHTANVRSDPLPSIHLVHALPVSAVWSGPERSEFMSRKLGYDFPPVLDLVTAGRTPFRYDNWCGDNMNTLVVAPTRTGKSTFAATVGMAMHQDPNVQVFSLDVDGDKSAIVPACLSAGGELLTFREDGAAMQPLSDLESEMGVEFSPAFLKFCCKVQGVEESLTPTQISNGVEAILSVLQDEPVHRRTMARAAKLAMYDEMTDAFRQYAEGGTWGRFTGGHKDVLGTTRWVTFELSTIMNKGPQAAPGMDCLFHKLEKRCDAARGQTMIQADEAWMLFRAFPEKVDEYLRRLPKKHAGMMMLIHNLLDLGPLTHMIRENCKQKAFMANPSATSPEGLRILADFDMNLQQAKLIASAVPKQDIYFVSEEGARLAHNSLPPIARALCASGGPENAALIRRLLAEGRENFGGRLLRAKGLHEAAEQFEAYDNQAAGGSYAQAAE